MELNSSDNKRWRVFLWGYTLLSAPFFVNIYIYYFLFVGSSPMSHVTNILLLLTSIMLVSLFFKPSRDFALKFLTLPYFGLVWTVFAVRLLFEVFSGADWFTQFIAMGYGETTTKIGIFFNLARFGDFILHFMPLLVAYHVMHVFKNQIRYAFLTLPRTVRIFLGFAPCFIIYLWFTSHDFHKTYLLPPSMIVDVGAYLFPLIVCLYTTYLFHVLHYPLKNLREFMNNIRFMALVAIGVHLILGIYLFGVSNLWVNALSWSAILVMTMVLSRYRSDNATEITGNLLLPTYGFVMGVYFFREFILTAEGGKHILFLSKILPGVFEPALLYTTYLFLSYIAIGPLVGEILLLEMPYDLKEDTPYKAYLRKHHYIIQEIWQGYGAFIIFAFYLALNGDRMRELDASKGAIAPYLMLAGAFVFSFVFSHMHYRRYGRPDV